MSENQVMGYLSQNGLKWRRTKAFTPYSIDRRPQLPQGKRPQFPQWKKRPQLLPRRPTVPPRSALKWRRKEDTQEPKAEENATQQIVRNKDIASDSQETNGCKETDFQGNSGRSYYAQR
ncbi:hypothetical protein J6590_095827 [Homalodisca vitripennis]|nr:hypothetical protein J6590_095827 [Homalodisca vitripennis]